MNKWIVALTVIIPTFLEVLDTSVVNVALGHIRGSLSAGLDEATWSLTAYLVANAIVIPLTGWLSRLFGRKRYLLVSVVLFTFSSFMCGNSKTLANLIFFRVLQGIGGGGLLPISQAILLEAFPPSQYGIAMALFGVGVMVAPSVGPMLGGWITDNWSWPWIFYINIPVGILSIIMIQFFIEDPDYLKKMHLKEKIDYLGLFFVVVGIGCLQIVLDKGQREDWFSSDFIIRLSIISIVSLVALVIVELRASNPILNLRVFKNICFASANIIQSAAFFVLYGCFMLLPVFLQQLMGYNAFLAGLAISPIGLMNLLVLPVVGMLVNKVSPKAILFSGLLIVTYAAVMMSRFNLFVDFNMVARSGVVIGIGVGMIFIPLASMAFATISKEEMSNATSIFNLLRNIAGSSGIAIMTTILARRAQFHQFRFIENLNPFDPQYQFVVQQATAMLNAKMGVASAASANGVIYQELMRQTTLFSFTDAFYVSAAAMLCVLPLVFLLKRPQHASENIMIH